MQQSRTSSQVIFRLTALWGLCESGLGGWMHALHLPFTGFFVGALAIILISLIGWYSGFSFRQIVQSTLLVLMVKAAVSPQSPPAAYLAVAFQGFLGAALYSLLRSFRLAAILLGVLTMIESAVQKIIVATLIFGNALWEALDKFFQSIAGEIHLAAGTRFSVWIILAYTAVYALWGFLLGIWISRLPRIIETRAATIRAELQTMKPKAGPDPAKGNKRRGFRIAGYMLVLLLIIAVLFAQSGGLTENKALYIVLRTLAVLGMLVFIINPLLRTLIRYYLSKRTSLRKPALDQVLSALPALGSQVGPAYSLASQKHRGMKRIPAFVVILIVSAITPDEVE